MVARRSLREISDLHLAVIVAGATLLGGVLTSFTNAFLIDAGTEKQTDVQLVELAIGILGEPIPEGISRKLTPPIPFSEAGRSIRQRHCPCAARTRGKGLPGPRRGNPFATNPCRERK